MNYVDEIARAVAERCNERWDILPDEARSLYRVYAVLVLTTGGDTTNQNVHDAWAAWRAATMPDHKSLVPFDRLSPEVQELDTPYREAIRAIAALAYRVDFEAITETADGRQVDLVRRRREV